MKKKSDKVETEVERDEEDEEEDAVDGEDSDSDEGEEEVEERPAVSARAVADERRARRTAAAAKAPKKTDAHDDHAKGHDDEDEESAGDEDPSWWLPHAVMSALVLIGVLGFFGTFNKILAPLAAHPAVPTETKEETKAVEPTKGATPPAPMPMPPQAPREMFAAKHLLVMYKGGRRAPENVTRTKEEAKARATEAQKKAKDGKSKFEDLVKEYSDEPKAGERGGDLGTFPKGSMVPEFQAALDKMKIGDISDVVETPFGFHVILRTAPAAPAMPPGH